MFINNRNNGQQETMESNINCRVNEPFSLLTMENNIDSLKQWWKPIQNPIRMCIKTETDWRWWKKYLIGLEFLVIDERWVVCLGIHGGLLGTCKRVRSIAPCLFVQVTVVWSQYTTVSELSEVWMILMIFYYCGVR